MLYTKLIVEQEIEEMTKKDDSGTIKEIISEDEIKLIKYEIKAILFKERTNKISLFKKLFKKYKDEGTLSIKKLIKKLSKKPLNLSFIKSKTLARYIIEPREESTIEYNAKRKKEVKEIRKVLDNLLDINYKLTVEKEYEEAIKEALEVISPEFIKMKADFGVEIINLNKWLKVFKEHFNTLNPLYEDALLSIAFESTKDINNLSLDVSSY
jgi:hypothetical protein